jgi:hypothetical protein
VDIDSKTWGHVKDYYAILNVIPSADQGAIKSAYRQKALQYHPDRNTPTVSKEKFIEATEAYEVLSDTNERSKYDRLRNLAAEGARKAREQAQAKARTRPDRKSAESDRKAQEQRRQQERRWEARGKQKAEQYWKMEFKKFATEVGRGSTTHMFYGLKFTWRFMVLLFWGVAGLFLGLLMAGVFFEGETPWGMLIAGICFGLFTGWTMMTLYWEDVELEWDKYEKDPRT